MSKWLNQDYLTRAYASRALSRPDVTVSRECQTSSLCPVIDYWLRSGHLRQWARHNSPPIILLHPHRSTPVKGEPILSNPREEIPKFPAQRFYLITITDPFDSRPYVRNVWFRASSSYRRLSRFASSSTDDSRRRLELNETFPEWLGSREPRLTTVTRY